MNLRQKCKRQKQRIEQLERMTLPVKKIYNYTYDSLNHLRLKRSIIIDWGMELGDNEEYFKDLTRNQMAKDIGVALRDNIIFDDEEGTATLDVWVMRKAESEEV